MSNSVPSSTKAPQNWSHIFRTFFLSDKYSFQVLSHSYVTNVQKISILMENSGPTKKILRKASLSLKFFWKISNQSMVFYQLAWDLCTSGSLGFSRIDGSALLRLSPDHARTNTHSLTHTHTHPISYFSVCARVYPLTLSHTYKVIALSTEGLCTPSSISLFFLRPHAMCVCR